MVGCPPPFAKSELCRHSTLVWPAAELEQWPDWDFLRLIFPQDMEITYPGEYPFLIVTNGGVPVIETEGGWEGNRNYVLTYEPHQTWTAPVKVQQIDNGVFFRTLTGENYGLIPETVATIV